MIAAFAAAVLLAGPFQGARQPAPEPGNPAAGTARAHRTARAPTIDGSNAEAAWREARRNSEFLQFEPREGAPPSFRTEFQVSYDEHNLYVFVRAHDPHPDSIRHALSRRDQRGPSDQIIVFVDSYDDNRTGYYFAVNPDGVKRDYALYNDGTEDGSWNAVWDVAARVDSLGWAAEYRIPLSQLRYADASAHTFGFGVWRDIERYQERISWPEFRRTRSGLVSQLGVLEGLVGLAAPRHIEVTPYSVAKTETRPLGGGAYEQAQKLTAGADLKLSLTPNMTLSATVNPDFGQVEADPAVLNLSAFETFVREQRPFFVEGTGQYRFALNCYIVVDCGTNEGLFYSRRIGRAPTLRGAYGDAATAATTPIAGAAKLTGRTRGGFSYGVLDALTTEVTGTQDRSVEPLTNYAVLSAQQDLRGGEAGISALATAVNRALDPWTEPVLHEGAYAGGLSFRNRFGGRSYELSGSVAASHLVGSADAIARTQRSAVHYYQQPADEARYDPTRTTLSGHAEQLKFGKYSGGIARFETSLVHQSAGFDVNDLGYLRRADRIDWSTWAALRWQTPTRVYRQLQVNGNHWQNWNTSGTRTDLAFNGNAHMWLHNGWNLHGGATIGSLGESYCDRCSRGGPLVRESREIHPWFGVNGDNRARLVPSMWVNLGFWGEGRSQSVSLNPSLALRFSTRLQASVGARLNNTHDDAQWYGNLADPATGETHYAFAHLRQRTLSMNLRVNYTAAPDLTFEFYGEPFVSRGAYTNLRELSATPGAQRYEERYVAYGFPEDAATRFRVSQLRTNTVVRWEYRPGSTLFLVWAHGRSGSGANERDGWRQDYRDLFALHPENTLLVKLAYWLNP